MRESVAAIRHVEEAVLGARWTEGIVLRYGVFYGPGTSMAPGEEQFELVRRHRFPVVGGGGGVLSFVHVADAAEATVAVFAGEVGVVMMTEVRGASNAKAKRELGWRPAHASWRQGFATA
jgi:nucleoside-diphosphate-sugar epimerase